MPNKQISLPSEIFNKVEQKQSKGWNFSGWVTDKLRTELLQDIPDGELPEELIPIQFEDLDRQERRFLSSVDYGSDHEKFDEILEYYNKEFNRDFTKSTFTRLLNSERRTQSK